MPPSLLATALLLQTYDKVSKAEAKARADFHIRWKSLGHDRGWRWGLRLRTRPLCQEYAADVPGAAMILHEKVREVFESSLRLARQSGYLKKRGMRVALDTTYILSRGAVTIGAACCHREW